MEKNYLKISSCIKSGLFLVIFLFFGFYGVAQSISKPTVKGIPVCKGSEIEVSFIVTNGTSNSENSGQWFTSLTQYQIIINNGSTTRVLATEPHGNTLEGPRQLKEFTFYVQIPETDFYQPGVNYRIQINSTNPTVSSEFPSDVFNIKTRPPSPIASNNGPLCAGNSIQLTANTIPNATYTWNGPGGFTSFEQNPIRPSSTASMAGIYIVTATVNGCASEPATTNVVVNAIPTITGSTPGSRCGTGTVVLGATASAGTINWYAAATGGASLGMGTTFTTPSISSNTIYYVDATLNGCTTGSRSAVLATVNTIPTITGSTPGSRCGTGTVVLGATASAGTINWFAAATGGESLGTGTTFTTPSISSNTIYYVDATLNSCTTGTRTAVIATVNTIPSAPTPDSNSPICAGETINLTASSIDGATYSWTGPNGFTSTLQNPSLINASAAMAGTYTVTVTLDGCTSIAASTIVVVNDSFTWTGATNSDWNTTSNWSCNSLPTLETDILIPRNLSSGNYPVINAGVNALSKNLNIENGASVRVIDNWLRITGVLTNFGILNTETGSVSFEGSATQTIPAAAFQNNRIQNLRIDNASGVTSEAIIEVTGILKVENGNFNTGNELTLISDATQTALIDGSGNGQVIGLVTMQRYLDVAFGYKYFSSPFSETTAGDFTDIDLTASFPNFYRYDENRSLMLGADRNDATGWEPITDPASALNVLEGYALNFGENTNATVVELTGVVNNGTYNRALENNNREFTRGFHLIGNPYPSPIDWEATEGWVKTNIEDGIYFFTAGESQYTGTYTSYVNGISSTDGKSSGIIPSLQGFFVKVTDPAEGVEKVTGSLTVSNKVRVTNFDQEFFKTPEQEEKSLLRLTAAFEGAGSKDAMVVYFSANSGTRFNKETDAHKLMNTDTSVPNLYSLSEDNINLSIKAIPFPESGSYEKIPLGITAERSGRMRINLADLQNIPANWNIYLIDKEKRIGQNLRKKSTYSFIINEGEHHDRFQLMFSQEKMSDPAIAFDDLFSVESGDFIKVNLNLEEGQKGELRISTVTGQLLEVKEGRGKEQVEFRSITSSGIYFINLYVNDQRYSKKVLVNK